MIMYLTLNPDLKKRLLDEVTPALEKAKEDFVRLLDYDTVMDFEFLHCVFYETLRIEPPVPTSTSQTFSHDVTLQGKGRTLQVPKGTMIFLGIWAMHLDPE